MGFTRAGGDVGRNTPELSADDVDDPIGLDRLSRDNADHDSLDFAARVAARHTPRVRLATAEPDFGTGHMMHYSNAHVGQSQCYVIEFFIFLTHCICIHTTLYAYTSSVRIRIVRTENQVREKEIS